MTNSIPVAGSLIVNTASWMRRLIKSIDYPIETFVIINNNGRGEIDDELNELAKQPHDFIKKFKVCHLPGNIGCGGGWNLIIKSHIMVPYWFIISHDVAFPPGFIEKMVHLNNDPDVGMTHASAGQFNLGTYDAFMIKESVVKSHGLFDENCYPAYAEDVDFIFRLQNKPIKKAFMDVSYYHGGKMTLSADAQTAGDTYGADGSQTWRSDLTLKEKIDHARYVNEEVYIRSKWGPNWKWCDVYPHPFNDPNLPMSYTTYDLNFIREKYLGF
jgi:hypothetical protein